MVGLGRFELPTLGLGNFSPGQQHFPQNANFLCVLFELRDDFDIDREVL
jgi:hypothetical protein